MLVILTKSTFSSLKNIYYTEFYTASCQRCSLLDESSLLLLSPLLSHWMSCPPSSEDKSLAWFPSPDILFEFFDVVFLDVFHPRCLKVSPSALCFFLYRSLLKINVANFTFWSSLSPRIDAGLSLKSCCGK